jgi:hypothetical protein
MHLTIFPKRVALLLISIALGLSVASLVGQYCLYFLNLEQFSAIANLFDVDRENNVPSFYGGFLLLFNAFLLAAIAIAKKRSRDRYTLHWQGLSIIFFYLSFDEWFSIHETVNKFINQTGGMTGEKQWDVLNSIVLVLFSFAYLKFFFHLPKQLRKLFFISALLFVVGALGIELIGSNFFAYIYNQPRFISEIVITIEELLEMLGTALFSYALLLQIIHLPIHNISIEITEPYLLETKI